MKEKIFWSGETKPELSGRKCKLIVGFVVTSNNEALLVVLTPVFNQCLGTILSQWSIES